VPRCGPGFDAFHEVVAAALKRSALSPSGLCGPRAGKQNNFSDSYVRKFIIRACISGILCDVIYRPRDEIAGALQTRASRDYPDWFVCKSFQLSDPEVEKQCGMFFGVFKFSSGTYLAIRGTVGSSDWEINLANEAEEFMNQPDFVHKGFLARARKVPLELIARDAG